MQSEKSKSILAKRILELRCQKKMSQIRLSTHLGISQESVSSIERGASLPRLQTLIEISKVFDCSLDYLVGLSDVKKAAITQETLSSHENHLICNFQKCNQKNKEIILFLSDILSNKDIVLKFDDNTTIVKNFISSNFENK